MCQSHAAQKPTALLSVVGRVPSITCSTQTGCVIVDLSVYHVPRTTCCSLDCTLNMVHTTLSPGVYLMLGC